MGFLNPWVFAALAALAAPVIIHLLNKFRVRQTAWAAMRFVHESLQKNRKRVELQDLLLLLLRCLVVLLLVLAFTQPVLQELTRGQAGGRGPMAAVVILDNSASMEQSDGVETRFEKAKHQISEWVEALEPGSNLALLLASDRAETIIPRLTTDMLRVRRSLELIESSDQSTDLYPAIAAAYEILREANDERLEIHLYTDSQQTAWDRFEDIRRLQQEYPAILLQIFVMGDAGEANLAVTAIESLSGVPTLSRPSRYRVDVANFGTTDATNVRVTLGIDKKPPSDETLIDQIPAGATRSAELFVSFAESGFHNITATIPPDRLPIDNQRTTTLQVVDRMRALILEGSRSRSNAETGSFFLANALAPVSFEQVSRFFLSVTTQPAERLSSIELAAYDLIFLSNLRALNPREGQLLRSYVERGGALVIFPGPQTEPTAWRNDPALLEILPAEWGPLTEASGDLRVQAAGYEHPVATIWRNEQEGNFGSVQVSRYFPLTLREPTEEERPGQVILRLQNGDVLAAERSFGAGKVALFGSAATPEWNNLPLHPGFVPLMQKLTGYLTDRDALKGVLRPGESFGYKLPIETLGLDFSVVRPGADSSRRPAGRVELIEQRASIQFQDTEKAGPYEIYLGDEPLPRVKFSVQIDAGESDVRQLAASDLQLLEDPPEASSTDAAEAPAFAQRMQVTFEFWTLLMILAALAAASEAGLAHYLSRAR